MANEFKVKNGLIVNGNQKLINSIDLTKYANFNIDNNGNYSIQSSAGVKQSSAVITTISTDQTVLHSFSIEEFVAGEYIISAKKENVRQVTKILLIHDGTSAFSTEFGTILTSDRLFNVEVDINLLNVRMLVTPTSKANTIFKTQFTLLGSIGDILENITSNAGGAGFGVGVYNDGYGGLPSGFTALDGTNVPTSDNYGNYQYSDGSIMCWIPKFYYRIGSSNSSRYQDYGLNAIDIAFASEFVDEADANQVGFALHRAFKNGGIVVNGFMIDKYQCSKNGSVASSIKNGAPLSSSSAHNPFSSIGCANSCYGAIDAAKTRGPQFHCASRFQFASLALLSIAHGQAATSSTHCAWYDANKSTNFPKGNNNYLKDINEASLTWTSDGYSNPASGLTGSASVFAKSTHNGQNCGVADLNGNMWEINLGMTRPGSNASDGAQQNDAAAFYVLKESIDVNALTGGWSDQASGLEAWGNATHLATLYDTITLSHIGNGTGWQYFGNGDSQVLDSAISGDGYRQTALGVYTSAGHGTGINLFGNDGIYEYHRANLCLLSGGTWSTPSTAGVWALYLNVYRTDSYHNVGFRAAAYV